MRALGIVFLALVGVCAAEATQAVGALLLVGLIAGPAGIAAAAHRPAVGRPRRRGAASRSAAMWIGLIVSYLNGSLPPSFSIMAVIAGGYVLAVAVPDIGIRAGRRRPRESAAKRVRIARFLTQSRLSPGPGGRRIQVAGHVTQQTARTIHSGTG